jgi:hypothetical protein
MVGGGSAIQADSPNPTNATTTKATAKRNGLTDRPIVSPPIPVFAPYPATTRAASTTSVQEHRGIRVVERG